MYDGSWKVIEVYDSLPTNEKLNLDFDLLAEKVGINQSRFRATLLNALWEHNIDCGVLMLIVRCLKPLVEKSVSITMDETHPGSYIERKAWLELELVAKLN